MDRLRDDEDAELVAEAKERVQQKVFSVQYKTREKLKENAVEVLGSLCRYVEQKLRNHTALLLSTCGHKLLVDPSESVIPNSLFPKPRENEIEVQLDKLVIGIKSVKWIVDSLFNSFLDMSMGPLNSVLMDNFQTVEKLKKQCYRYQKYITDLEEKYMLLSRSRETDNSHITEAKFERRDELWKMGRRELIREIVQLRLKLAEKLDIKDPKLLQSFLLIGVCEGDLDEELTSKIRDLIQDSNKDQQSRIVRLEEEIEYLSSQLEQVRNFRMRDKKQWMEEKAELERMIQQFSRTKQSKEIDCQIISTEEHENTLKRMKELQEANDSLIMEAERSTMHISDGKTVEKASELEVARLEKEVEQGLDSGEIDEVLSDEKRLRLVVSKMSVFDRLEARALLVLEKIRKQKELVTRSRSYTWEETLRNADHLRTIL